MRRKVVIISSLLHNPPVILFDEPLDGLDANAAVGFKALILTLARQGRTIVYRSHSSVVLAFHLSLRWFGRERLNSLITTSQVVIAMVTMLGGQLVPRMMRHTDLEHWTTSPWLMTLPPAWFGALDTLAVTLSPAAGLGSGHRDHRAPCMSGLCAPRGIL